MDDPNLIDMNDEPYVLNPQIEEEKPEEDNSIMFGFCRISQKTIKTSGNTFYINIQNHNTEMMNYLEKKILKFPKIFNPKFKNFSDALNYLKNIAIPNKCVCAGVIDSIPGWRCVDCSKYENSIYCYDCFIKSKEWHKNHEVYYLYSSGGMCDCGDPDSLYKFCKIHSGPYLDQKEINKYIEKTFSKDILSNLKKFFDDLFQKFSKYFILTEKCRYFMTEILEKTFKNQDSQEKKDLLLLKRNFCIIFQNFINFLREITKNNLGMLHLIATYFLNNHFINNNNLEDQYKTSNICINFNNKEIKILNKNKKIKENDMDIDSIEDHKCQCPFFRLLISNWRDRIKSKENENEELLLSFAHNYNLRCSFVILYYFMYDDVLLNANDDIIYNRNQFFIEDTTALIASQTNLFEESFEIFYKNFSKVFNNDNYNSDDIDKFLNTRMVFFSTDSKYLSKPKIKNLIADKTSLIKRLIDCFCLLHNKIEFKSIVPHPPFQNKGYISELINLELTLSLTENVILMCLDYNNKEKIKEISFYLINKILNQKKEGIKQLEKNEYSFHLTLYRFLGNYINFFCFNYANVNKCTIFDAIEFAKNNFFNSKNDINKFIKIILEDYFKMFGFLTAIRNGYFNYYNDLENYNYVYFTDQRNLRMDFTLIKYLLAMSENKINLEELLKISNIENVYSFFNQVFNEENSSISNNVPIDNNSQQKNRNNDSSFFNFFLMNDNTIQDSRISQLLSNFMNNFFNRNQMEDFGFSLNNNNDNEIDEQNKHILQWVKIIEIIISILKNDFTPYWNILKYLSETVSSKTKKEYYNDLKKNAFIYEDMKNILREKIIHMLIANKNFCDLKTINSNVDEFFHNFFSDQEFNEILDEVTSNKMNVGIKIFFLKDSCLKYLDMNYYLSPYDKSKAELYISDFKKDLIKMYNSYFFKPSKFTFDFYLKAYESILLNTENLNFVQKILNKLLSNKDINYGGIQLKSIKNSFLPIILNYLTIFGSINTKSFVKFKENNNEKIHEICKLLDNVVELNQEKKNLFDKNIEEFVIEVIHTLRSYNRIKIKDYDYNIENNEMFSIKNSSDIQENKKFNEGKKNKIKQMKSLLKDKMKNKANKAMQKLKLDKSINNVLNETSENNLSNNCDNLSDDEIMCFYCRTTIKLNSFEKPYGKLGNFFKDYFYNNCLNSAVRSELFKYSSDPNNDNNLNEIYKKITNKYIKDQTPRITSCGHYFHQNCFKQGNISPNSQINFSCPVCLKNQNVLVPPLTNFIDKKCYLQSEKIINIFNDKKLTIPEYKKDNENESVNNMIFNFLINIDNNFLIIKNNKIDYCTFLENIFNNYKSFSNFIENLLYNEASSFHKNQQIDTFQNFILSIRYIVKNKILNINEVADYIKNKILSLIEGPKISDQVMNNYESFYYLKILDTILFSLLILLNSDELCKIYPYLLYIFLPYFIFGFYLRDLEIKNNFTSLYDDNIKNNITLENLISFIKSDAKNMNNCLKYFLEKLAIIKILSDYKHKNDYIINKFHLLKMSELVKYINLEFLIDNINENTDITKILDVLPTFFNNNDNLYEKIGKSINIKKIFDSLINNIKTKKQEKYLIKKELLLQFTPLKFQLIYLDNNIFDFIIRTQLQPCIYCHKSLKFNFICLICGEKICHTSSCNEVEKHAKECGGKTGIFVNMDDLKYYYCNNSKKNNVFSIYVNEVGIGPSGYELGANYYLCKNNVKKIISSFVSDDYN